MATTSEVPVLEQIFKTLQRLETQVDGQSNRLNAIELSIKSRSSDIAASSTDESPSETSNSGFSHHGQSQRSTSPVTTHESHFSGSPAALYKASVVELQNRFEFSESSWDVGAPPAGPAHKQLGGDGAEGPAANNRTDGSEHEWEDEAVYTESAYSQHPSRLDLANLADVPPLPNDIHLQRYVHSTESRLATPDFTGRDASSTTDPIRVLQPSELDGPHRLRALSRPASISAASTAKCTHCGHQAGSDQEASSQSAADDIANKKPSQWRVLVAQRHERAEMALFAWKCFKVSLRSSWWFNSEERRVIQSETRRIAEVLTPATAASSLSRRAREVVGKVRSMLARRLNKAASWVGGTTVVSP